MRGVGGGLTLANVWIKIDHNYVVQPSAPPGLPNLRGLHDFQSRDDHVSPKIYIHPQVGNKRHNNEQAKRRVTTAKGESGHRPDIPMIW